jgi:hypothetical protein
LNLGNFLNKEWGIQRSVATSSILIPTNTAALLPDGTVKPTFRLQTDTNTPTTRSFRDAVGFGSTFSMQFGLRYIFN